MRYPVMRRAACALVAGVFLSGVLAAPASARFVSLGSFGEASPERAEFAREGGQAPAPVTAIRAGRLLDPEAGRILTNQIILIEGTRIRDVGPGVAIPAGAQVIDLSNMTVEMAKDHNIVYPEYLDADTPDEIVKAVRQNALFGARVIKICVDCKPWGYSVDEIRLFIKEAAKIGLKVEGHVQTVDGGKRAVEAGIWSIAHDRGMTDSLHKEMARKGVWRAGTETPLTLVGHTTKARYDFTVQSLRNAWQNKAPLTFSTDADYYVPGKTRGEVAIEFIETWKAAGIPPRDILRAMTTNGFKVSETEATRGPIKVGLRADFIAVMGNPLDNIDALRDVRFVMKNGMVFKRDGVMTPGAFFNGGPVNGYNAR